MKQGLKIRDIHEPSQDLKEAQRYIAEVLGEAFRSQFIYTYAYQTGKRITDAVKPHVNMPLVMTMDIKNFFPSVPSGEIIRACEAFRVLEGYRFEEISLEDIVKIVIHPTLSGVPQGAPSSPMISNIAFLDYDNKIADISSRGYGHYWNYTRYADDLIFSGEYSKKDAQKLAAQIQDLLVPVYQVSSKKTKIMIDTERQEALGLVLNTSHTVTKELKNSLRGYLHTLGREKKEIDEHTEGMLSFICSVDRVCYLRLLDVYNTAKSKENCNGNEDNG